MSAITQKGKEVLRLINRSPVDSEGWSRVSPTVLPLLDFAPAELIERSFSSEFVRLTEAGKTVVKYIP